MGTEKIVNSTLPSAGLMTTKSSGLNGSASEMEHLTAGDRQISVLCVDDNAGVLEALTIFFAHEPDFILETCDTATAALGLLSQKPFDVIVADYAMPDMDGIALLKEVRLRGFRMLFIIFTARHLARVPIEALNNGGNYYLQKGTDIFSELPKMVKYIRKNVAARDAELLPSPEELRYRSLVENPLDLICSFLPDGSFTLANERFLQFIGKNSEEIFSTDFFSLVPDSERESVRGYVAGVSHKKPGIYLEHAVTTRDGSRRVEWAYRAVMDPSGTVTEIHAQGRDVASIRRLSSPLTEAPADNRTPSVTPVPASIQSSGTGSSDIRSKLVQEAPEGLLKVEARPPKIPDRIKPAIQQPAYSASAIPDSIPDRTKTPIQEPAPLTAAMPEEIQPGREKVREEDVPASASRIAEPERDYSARLREIADSVEPLQYPVFAIDHNGVVIAWNHAIAALTGIRPEDITGCGAYAYAVPFYGSARPMLIDRILHPDKPFNPDLPPLTREGPTYIGEIEEVTIRGKHMLMKGMGTRIQDTRGSLIAAIQSLMVREQTPAHIAEADTTTEEYLGGVSSTVVKITGTGLLGTIAGAVGSTTGGYGVYATTKRLIVVHNPELDASRKNGIQFGSFIMDELFGSSVDVRIRSLDELENDKVFEVWRKDIASIDMKSPRLLAGYIIIRTKSGDSFRVFIDHKKAFIHLE